MEHLGGSLRKISARREKPGLDFNDPPPYTRMKRFLKTLRAVSSGTADANIRFDDLCGLLLAVGFRRRIRGDHHIFVRDGVAEILNLQPLGSKAKAYQVRQTRKLFEKYDFEEIDDPAV